MPLSASSFPATGLLGLLTAVAKPRSSCCARKPRPPVIPISTVRYSQIFLCATYSKEGNACDDAPVLWVRDLAHQVLGVALLLGGAADAGAADGSSLGWHCDREITLET